MSYVSDQNRVKIDIDLDALSFNCQSIQKQAPHSKIMAMVKANAYGHGVVKVAQTLSNCGVSGFGVARLPAAIALRNAGIKQKILLLSGPLTIEELYQAQSYQLDLVIHHQAQVELLKNHLKTNAKIWLKFDSGMGRLGFNAGDFIKAYEDLKKIPFVEDDIILMSHLACADSQDREMSIKQLDRCLALNSGLELTMSLGNSAGILQYPDVHTEWVRPGIILYGISPFCDMMSGMINLKPVMTVKSRLLAVKEIPQGASVGYGASWIANKPTRIGVVACGYADGYLRSARPGTPTLLANQRCEVIGRVSMDMMTINLNSVPNANVGDWVELWGKSLPIQDVAQSMGAIPYELCAAIRGGMNYLAADQKNSESIN